MTAFVIKYGSLMVLAILLWTAIDVHLSEARVWAVCIVIALIRLHGDFFASEDRP